MAGTPHSSPSPSIAKESCLDETSKQLTMKERPNSNCFRKIAFARPRVVENNNNNNNNNIISKSMNNDNNNSVSYKYATMHGKENTKTRRSPSPITKKTQPIKNASKHSRESNIFPIPTAPPMRYTSSTAFSDISLPLPNLAYARSFGPSGYFTTHHHHYPTTTTHAPPPPPPPFYHAQSFGQKRTQPSESLLETPKDCEPVTNVDLTIAAHALLDLTPAVTQKRPVIQAIPPSITSNEHAKIPPSKKHRTSSNNTGLKRNKKDAVINTSFKSGVEQANSQITVAHAKLSLRAQSLLEDVPLTVVACKCKNTQCLKLYCNCFQTGSYCDELVCKCKDCNNTKEHSAPRGNRTRAIYDILHRRPDAFDTRLKKKTGEGCSCKKSRCLQKYCDCFAIGAFCAKGKCSCTGCHNTEDMPDDYSSGGEEDSK